MHLRMKVVLPVAALLLAALMFSAFTASVHEHRDVGGYDFTVGFLNEPAIVDEPNGLDLRIQKGQGEDGTPIEGLADTLQGEVSFGSQTMPLEIRAAFGEPGAYKSDFIPSAPGAYTFHITGAIEGMDVDESFTSGPDTFSEVEERAAMLFPAADSQDSATSTASDAQDTANTAQTVGIVGIVAGVLGVVLAIAALAMARRPAATETARGTPAHDLTN